MSLVTVFLIALLVSVVPLPAQTVTPAPADSSVPSERLHRSPSVARTLGTVLPGAGHIYAGEYSRGYATYLTTVASFGMAAMLFILDGCTLTFDSHSCDDSRRRWLHRAGGAAGVGVGVWTWVKSARDAPRAARRANERDAGKRRSVSLFVEPHRLESVQVNAGITVRW